MRGNRKTILISSFRQTTPRHLVKTDNNSSRMTNAVAVYLKDSRRTANGCCTYIRLFTNSLLICKQNSHQEALDMTKENRKNMVVEVNRLRQTNAGDDAFLRLVAELDAIIKSTLK